MTGSAAAMPAGQDGYRPETARLKRNLTLLPVFSLVYFTVCGGAFGAEPMVGWSGPGIALLLFLVTPLLFSIPNMLMVREMQSMMPAEGGYYHWIRQAFGPFAGFMAGWMNWIVAWVDVSIYPVLGAYYLGYFIPALREGAVIGGMEVPAWFLSWLVALVLIWAITALNVRGARIAALFTSGLGAVMLLPLIAMSVVGFGNFVTHGSEATFSLLPEDVSLTEALSVGLFVAMWNFMGWELPAAAGDEIVNPKKTYPRAMLLVLLAAIATYSIPTLAGLYGGAGENGAHAAWGIEEYEEGAGIGEVLAESGYTEDDMAGWGVDPAASAGWEFPDIAHAIGVRATGEDSPLPGLLGGSVMVAAILSMIGLFIGNGLGGTRIPFAMAADGMLPRWLVHVHPRYGTPWVAIVLCGVIFSVFSLQAFAFLVVVDVFLNVVVLMTCFFALWRLRFTLPDVPRSRVPGGYVGLVLVTVAPALIIVLAVVSQIAEEGMSSLGLALVAMAVGAALYLPMRRLVKPGVPDINPFESAGDGDV